MATSVLTSLEIIAISNAELEAAGDGFSRSRRLQLCALLIGLISVFISGPWAYMPALAALAIQMISWGVRHKAAKRQSVGDQGRIRGLLHDAIGYTQEPVDLGDWLARVSSGARTAAQGFADPEYFSSKNQRSMQRLRDNLQENAFWGKHQYAAAKEYYFRATAAVVVVSVAALLISLPLVPDGWNLWVARLLVVALASGALVTQVSEIQSWRSAETRTEILDRRLDAIAACSEAQLKKDQLGALLSAYGDYCVASSLAPPVPHSIYKKDRDRLNELWDERQQP